jgi:hypothetical protein
MHKSLNHFISCPVGVLVPAYVFMYVQCMESWTSSPICSVFLVSTYEFICIHCIKARTSSDIFRWVSNTYSWVQLRSIHGSLNSFRHLFSSDSNFCSLIRLHSMYEIFNKFRYCFCTNLAFCGINILGTFHFSFIIRITLHTWNFNLLVRIHSVLSNFNLLSISFKCLLHVVISCSHVCDPLRENL